MAEPAMNIYKSARIASGLSGERAAELLRVDVATVRRWENGTLTPPNARVADMVATYDAPSLALLHLRQVSEELDVIPQISPQRLSTAVLRLCNLAKRLQKSDLYGQLMEIAEDGIIDAQERPIFDELTDQLREFIAAVYQVALTTDFADAKKERPTGGSVKRSGFERLSQNDCRAIIQRKSYACQVPAGNGGAKA